MSTRQSHHGLRVFSLCWPVAIMMFTVLLCLSVATLASAQEDLTGQSVAERSLAAPSGTPVTPEEEISPNSEVSEIAPTRDTGDSEDTVEASEATTSDGAETNDTEQTSPEESVCDCQCDDDSSASYVLESIEILGNRRTRDSVILRALSFRPGQVLDLDDPSIDIARYRLLALGFFASVDLSLRRGSRRGAVVLVVEVQERWTFIARELFFGVSEITPYGGLHVDELNLIGLGISLSGAFVAARDQQGYRAGINVPRLLDSPMGLSFEFLYNDAQDFLGRSTVLTSDSFDTEPYALIDYRRIGGSIGTGVRAGHHLNIYLDYRLEVIDADYPDAAAQIDPTLGGRVGEPIYFHLNQGRSVLSALALSLDYDTRDHPFLPSRGHRIALTTTISTDFIGSNYHFFKLTLQADYYLRFRWRHSLHFRLLLGSIFGDAPLFERYFIGDLSDLNHSRVLDLNFSHAPAPNILRNSIEEMQYESLAGRLDIEYIVPLYQGRRGVYRLDFFVLLGVYALGSAEDFDSPPAGYEGGPFPIDLTMNLGFRLDTTAGVFGFSFSNLLALIPFGED